MILHPDPFLQLLDKIELKFSALTQSLIDCQSCPIDSHALSLQLAMWEDEELQINTLDFQTS